MNPLLILLIAVAGQLAANWFDYHVGTRANWLAATVQAQAIIATIRGDA